MKILHVISSGGMYGAEAVILNLMRASQGGPHQAAVCVFRNALQPNLQLYERALAEGLCAYTVECRGQLDRALPRALRDLVQSTGADLVHAHGYKADMYAYAALRSHSVTLVSTCHTWYDNNLALRFYGALDRFILRNYARVAAVSEEVQQRLLTSGVRENRVDLIRNGIDLQAFSQQPTERDSDRPLRVGLVGRLAWEKGVDIFLRAAAKVLTHSPLTHFLVVGDGPDREQLQALVEALGIGRNVSLLGRREDMPAFYHSLDLLVSSSRQEGLPVALLEAMASGLPLVASAVGAVPSVVRHGETGILVAPANVPALAQSILDLLNDPQARLRLGSAARTLVEQEFSADRMAADYLAFYKQSMQTSREHAA